MDWIPIILSIVATVVSVAAVAREWRFGKPDALTRYEDLVNKLTARVDALELENRKLVKRADALETENKELKASQNRMSDELEDYRLGVVILITQMEGAKLNPKWRPREKKEVA